MIGDPRPGTLLLTRNDVAQLLSLDETIEAVEHAFSMQHSSKTTIAGLSLSSGSFHIKAATLEFDRPFFAAKVNANPSNRMREGLPTIQGTIDLCLRHRYERMAAELKQELGIEIQAIRDHIEAGIRPSDICITCTPSRHTLVRKEWVKPGTFLAAVGADSEDKQEIDPQLMASSKVVVDVLDQCAAIGDLHHAITQGLMTRSDVHGDLGAVVTKRIAGRERPDEIIVFDSTGSALEDVAAAVRVYRKAVSANRGLLVDFSN